MVEAERHTPEARAGVRQPQQQLPLERAAETVVESRRRDDRGDPEHHEAADVVAGEQQIGGPIRLEGRSGAAAAGGDAVLVAVPDVGAVGPADRLCHLEQRVRRQDIAIVQHGRELAVRRAQSPVQPIDGGGPGAGGNHPDPGIEVERPTIRGSGQQDPFPARMALGENAGASSGSDGGRRVRHQCDQREPRGAADGAGALRP
jgi:hypothetical protein